MRKKVAFIFVLLATIVLLAHAVIPHHHHNTKVMVATVCNHHTAHHNHGSIPVCNEKHHDKETSTCLLSMAIFTSSNQNRSNDFANNFEPTNALHEFTTFLIGNTENSSNSKPYIQSTSTLYSLLIPCSIGLRAPPIC